jgi:integrase/recombinase XerD
MPREGKARVLREAEFQRLLKVIRASAHAARNTALMYVSFGLGLRVQEIARLSIGDVRDSQGQLREEVVLGRALTKGSRVRMVYLSNSKVRQSLQAYLEERRQLRQPVFAAGAPLFLSHKGSRFTPNSLQQVFTRLFRAAGIEGASSHSGRRTFATRLIEKGIDIKAVARLMGHRSVATTAEYVEDNPTRLKTIAREVL